MKNDNEEKQNKTTIDILFSDVATKLLPTKPTSKIEKVKNIVIQKDNILFSEKLAKTLRKNKISDEKFAIQDEEEFRKIILLFSERILQKLKRNKIDKEKSTAFRIRATEKIHKFLFSLWIEMITGIHLHDKGDILFEVGTNYRFPISSLIHISTANMIHALSKTLEIMCEGGILVADNPESEAIAILLSYAVPKTKNFICIKKDQTRKWIWRIKKISENKEDNKNQDDKEKQTKVLILCDFDGTITKKDVSVALLEKFTDGEWKSSLRSVVKGNAGSKQVYKLIEQKLRGDEEEMKEFVRNFGEIEDGFFEFLNFIKREKINLEVVSDGFSFYISEILSKYGVKAKFYASELKWEEKEKKFIFKFPNQSEFCELCATCKLKILRCNKDKNGEKYIIFVGNGISDRCAVEEADFVFAKHRLKEICHMKGIDFSPFDTFHDIIDVMNRTPKCFVIDFDGTLGWSFEGIKDAFAYTFRKLKRTMPQEIHKLIGLPLQECFRITIGDTQIARKAVEIFRKRYREVFLRKTIPAPGAKQTLKKIKELGYKIVILSNKHGDSLRELVTHLELEADLVLGEGDILSEDGELYFKPSPKVIELVERKTGIKASDMLIVGDTEIDLITAKNSGGGFVALLSEAHPISYFEEKGKINFFISSIPGLIKVAELYTKIKQAKIQNNIRSYED